MAKILNDMEFAQSVIDVLPGLEHAKLLDIKQDANKIEGVSFFTMHEAEKQRIPGNVVGTFINESGELVFAVNTKNSHELIIGYSGAGKSKLILAAQILYDIIIGVNAVVVDPKAEHYRRKADIIKARGGQAYLINLRDGKHSELINPLLDVVDVVSKILDVGKNVVPCGDNSYIYKSERYTEEELAREYEWEIEEILNRAKGLLADLCTKLWGDMSTHRDAFFWGGASDMVKGLILGLAMYVISQDKSLKISPEKVNFSNVTAIYNTFYRERGKLYDGGFFTSRGKHSHVYNMVEKMFFQQADITARNLESFVDRLFAKLSSIKTITQGTTVAPEDLLAEDQQTVIFIDFDEADTANLPLLGFIIDYFVIRLKNIADESNGRLPRPVEFIIDEFPTVKSDYIAKAFSYLRSRQIFLRVAVQSIRQLLEAYGVNEGHTIIDNCSTRLFLGGNDQDTIESFAKESGLRATVMPTSDTKHHIGIIINSLPIVTSNDLTVKPPDRVYIKRIGCDMISSTFVPSYEHPDVFGEETANPGDYVCSGLKKRSEYIYDTSRLVYFDDDDDDDDDIFD